MNQRSKGAFIACFIAFVATTVISKKPNIVLIVADDLGWNDVGFHNPDMLTPNIDRLAREGVILDQHYVQPLCSPSRSAIMSGYYPFRTGLQHDVIYPAQNVCLPLDIKILPAVLRDQGYATHIVGKWHLGFCNWNCTPTYRGFDSFYGYYNALEDYYNHSVGGFLDFRNNTEVVKDMQGVYSTIKFASVAENLIKTHNKTQPLFLYLPYQAVHEPIEVPKHYEDMYPTIKNEFRRKYCGMVSALDEAIGNVTRALDTYGYMDDTLIIFTADNGGWIQTYGNNYPLRGGKWSIYEGGTRVNAFMHGAGLQKPGTVYDGLVHAVDWLPTITAIAGGQPVSDRDGMNLWPALSSGSFSPRNEFIYNIDNHFPPSEGHAAIRMGDYKLIDGYPGLFPDWYKPDQVSRVGFSVRPINYTQYRDTVTQRYQLFNLQDDPTEHVDLSESRPDIVKTLAARLAIYASHVTPARFPPDDPDSDPNKYGGVWSPGWC